MPVMYNTVFVKMMHRNTHRTISLAVGYNLSQTLHYQQPKGSILLPQVYRYSYEFPED